MTRRAEQRRVSGILEPIRRSRGFTLIEVLLAVTILATLSAIAWAAISQMFRTEEIVRERHERYRMVRLSMNRMADELSMAYLAGPDHGGEIIPGEEMFYEDDEEFLDRRASFAEPVQFGMIGRDDYVHFTAFGHIRTLEDERASHHAQIGYFVDTHQNENGERVRRLRRRVSTGFDDDLTRGGTVYTMISEVESVRFEYWDAGEPELGLEYEIAQGRWVSEWDTTNSSYAGRLPTRIRISVTLPPHGPRGQTETFVTQTTLGMTEVLEY